jgi:hypothetical protein
MNIKELREKQARITAEARERLDLITKETDESRAKELEASHDKAMAEFDRLEGMIERAAKVERAEAALRTARDAVLTGGLGLPLLQPARAPIQRPAVAGAQAGGGAPAAAATGRCCMERPMHRPLHQCCRMGCQRLLPGPNSVLHHQQGRQLPCSQPCQPVW